MGHLWIFDSGASTEEVDRGLSAANDVLARYGVSAADAWSACCAVARCGEVDGATAVRAAVWNEADAAAVLACCAGWKKIPPAAHLDFVSVPGD